MISLNDTSDNKLVKNPQTILNNDNLNIDS